MNHISLKDKVSLEEYGVELHLVRHGQDEEDKLGGWSENHLIDRGIEAVKKLRDEIDDDYDLFVSSDLIRTIETSEILNEKLNMDIIFDPDFREVNNGILKNMTKEEFKQKYDGLYFRSLKMDESYPNGESPNQFFNRIKNALIRLLEHNRNKKILLVTHGGVITVILCLVYGYDYTNTVKVSPKTATITKLKCEFNL